MWVYGYAGCGKSAISQAVAEQLSDEGCLAASFFFFKGSGDRGGITNFSNTIAYQLSVNFPSAADTIERVAKANPGLLTTSTSSFTHQFRELVCKPILSMPRTMHGTVITVVLDGVDECGDREEIAGLIESLIAFFDKYPRIPLRFVIASRVEGHLHQQLMSSNQVELLDLVRHTSDTDIRTALEVSIAREMRGRVMASDQTWPSEWEKLSLVKHIGGSYIFMVTILKLLFAPSTTDGLTPMERLPKILQTRPNFDQLYKDILVPCIHFPSFLDIVSTIALALQPISIAQIAALLGIRNHNVTNVLVQLHAILQVPGDDHTPVTVWHTSLRDFLCSFERSGPIFASPVHHQRLAHGAIRIAASKSHSQDPSSEYAREFGLKHLVIFLRTFESTAASFDTLLQGIMPFLVKATFKGALLPYFMAVPC
jgi:hypothetical protein